MKVIICEDNQQIANRIANYIENYSFVENNAIEVVLVSQDPFEVIEYAKMHPVECLFLDIDLGTTINGIDLAVELRKFCPLLSIIFVTTHTEMLKLTYKYRVEALDFIEKDNFENLKYNTIGSLKTAYRKYQNIGKEPSLRYFQIKIGEYIKNIKIDEIIYFKTNDVPHKVELVTLNGNFEFYDSLNSIETKDECFVRCNRAYIVNIKNIQSLNKKKKIVIMNNGESCPVSIRKFKNLEKLLIN